MTFEKDEYIDLKRLNVEKEKPRIKTKDKWTLNLLICCLTASSAALQFGFNLSSLNTTTIPVQAFIRKNLFLFNRPKLSNLDDNATMINDWENATSPSFSSGYNEVEMKQMIDQIWTFINCLYVLGQFIGGFSAKFVLEYLGRKRGFLFHNFFCILASTLVIIAPYVNSPVCVMISRFIFGIQSGLGLSVTPVYLSEIPPNSLRGGAGTFFQLFVSVGVSLSQLLGFKQIFGNSSYWHLQLGFPIIPGILGSIVFLLFLPESPKALLAKSDYEAAKKSLQLIRNKLDVNEELERLHHETKQAKSAMTFNELLKTPEMRWPLITTCTLFVGLQVSGINAIYFYSSSIFKTAGVSPHNIQYAILLTGLINIPSNLACLPLIDKFGRRHLILVTVSLAILDYIALTILLKFAYVSWIVSYACILCILLFIVLFALAIGPVPAIYACEVFRSHVRGTAISIANMISCVALFFVTFTFPTLSAIVNQYVFLFFSSCLSVVFIILFKKMPETKGKSVEEIIGLFNRDLVTYF